MSDWRALAIRTALYVSPAIGCAPDHHRATAPAPPAFSERLASSTAVLAPGSAEIYVGLSSTGLRVGLGKEARTLAVDKKAQGYFLVPLADAVRADAKGADAPLHAQLALDPSTSYRTLTEILYTLGQSEVGVFEFLVRNGDRVTAIHAVVPSARRVGVHAPALDLTVLATDDGIAMKANGGNIAPGCSEVGDGPAIRRTPRGDYDFGALRRCATKLQARAAQVEPETQVVILANADVDFQTIVSILDALRTSDSGGPLFTDPIFGVSR